MQIIIPKYAALFSTYIFKYYFFFLFVIHDLLTFDSNMNNPRKNSQFLATPAPAIRAYSPRIVCMSGVSPFN